jgi:hypothetical protein
MERKPLTKAPKGHSLDSDSLDDDSKGQGSMNYTEGMYNMKVIKV